MPKAELHIKYENTYIDYIKDKSEKGKLKDN
jgi:hypothetical protein